MELSLGPEKIWQTYRFTEPTDSALEGRVIFGRCEQQGVRRPMVLDVYCQWKARHRRRPLVGSLCQF